MYLELVRPAHVQNNGSGHPSAILDYTPRFFLITPRLQKGWRTNSKDGKAERVERPASILGDQGIRIFESSLSQTNDLEIDACHFLARHY